jgi:hypothetical protein
MEKIDRLGWAAGISFISYGVRIGVRANSPEALDLVQEYFPPGWKPSPSTIVERLYSFVGGNNGETQSRGVRRFNLLYRDISRLARTRNLEEALELFESDMQLHVATEAPRRIFVHAGVVGWKGQAILVPGRSHSGKTTLIAELLKAGATYYSDEYAVLDARGRVYPYPRSLQIREHETGKQKRYSVEKLGARAGVKPLPVKLVVVSQYKPGAKWRPRELSAGQGVLELLNHTVSARRHPEKAFAALQQVATQALILKSGRGEAEDVVASLFKYMDN